MNGVDQVSGSPGTTGSSGVVGKETAATQVVAGSKQESKPRNINCGILCLKVNISNSSSGSFWMSASSPFELDSNLTIGQS